MIDTVSVRARVGARTVLFWSPLSALSFYAFPGRFRAEPLRSYSAWPRCASHEYVCHNRNHGMELLPKSSMIP